MRKKLYPPIFDLCKCGCNEIVYGGKEWIVGHWIKIYNPAKKKILKIPSLCLCGCNEIVWNGIKYKGGHHNKLKEYKKLNSELHKGEKNCNYNKPAWNRGLIEFIGGKKNRGKIRSRECKEKISKTLMGKYIGEFASNWQGGLSYLPYCHKFNILLKNEVRKRDNHICQNCGITQEKHIEKYKQKLSIHHIHYDKENCYPDLITLCISCNSKANCNKIYWEKYFMNNLNNRKLLFWTKRKFNNN